MEEFKSEYFKYIGEVEDTEILTASKAMEITQENQKQTRKILKELYSGIKRRAETGETFSKFYIDKRFVNDVVEELEAHGYFTEVMTTEEGPILFISWNGELS